MGAKKLFSDMGIFSAEECDARVEAMPSLGGERQATYTKIKAETDKLKQLFEQKPHDLQAEAKYICDVIKPQMLEVRKVVDRAEGLLEAGLYPYPSYESLIYSHHS